MNLIVMEMLTDAHLQELTRQVTRGRANEKRGHRGPWITLPFAVAGLLVVTVGWTI